MSDDEDRTDDEIGDDEANTDETGDGDWTLNEAISRLAYLAGKVEGLVHFASAVVATLRHSDLRRHFRKRAVAISVSAGDEAYRDEFVQGLEDVHRVLREMNAKVFSRRNGDAGRAKSNFGIKTTIQFDRQCGCITIHKAVPVRIAGNLSPRNVLTLERIKIRRKNGNAGKHYRWKSMRSKSD